MPSPQIHLPPSWPARAPRVHGRTHASRAGRGLWWGAFVVGCLLVDASLAYAGETGRPPVAYTDTWKDVHPGLRYLRRESNVPSVAHVLVVDLQQPGLTLFATPYDKRWQTVTEFAEQNHVTAAVNGGFWNFMQRPKGLTSGEGKRWPDSSDDDEAGYFAVTVHNQGWISPPEVIDNEVAPARIREAVSGLPMLVRNGHVDDEALQAFANSSLRHPRTAAGVSRDGRTVYIVVVDGRQSHSRGMTLYELAKLFLELGAHNAINLDGGGSSAMYLGHERRVINSPSGGRWAERLGLQPTARKVRVREDGVQEEFVRGVEREVMNHIGIRYEPTPTVQHAAEAEATDEHAGVRAGNAARTNQPHEASNRSPAPAPVTGAGPGTEAGPTSWIHLGRSREILYPLAYGIAILSALLFFRWVLRRPRPPRPPDPTGPSS
jgi:uncharacterized protein YigE (DUF2233 family)